jgi:hypothetical protein
MLPSLASYSESLIAQPTFLASVTPQNCSQKIFSFTNFALIESVFEEMIVEGEMGEKLFRFFPSKKKFFIGRLGVSLIVPARRIQLRGADTNFFNTIKINDISLN